MKNKKKLLIIISSILLVSIIGFISFSKSNASNKGMMVTTAKLEKQDISSNILVKGELKSKDRSEISAKLPYRVNNIFVKEGCLVKSGDLLGTLDITDLNYEIEAAKLELSMQEAQYKEKNSDENIFTLRKTLEARNIDLESSKKKYEDSKVLHETGNLSTEELDNDLNAYKKAKNEVEIANANLNSALKNKNNDSDLKAIELKKLNLKNKIENISQSRLISPIEGTVTAINAKIGSVAEGTSGLFIIENIKSLQAKFDVNEFDISKLHIGQEITLTTESIDNKKFKGKITNIYPAAQVKENSTSGKQIVIPVIVDLVGNIDGLRPGLVIEANIETNAKKGALALPYEAIYEKPDKTNSVFIVKGGKLKEIPIRLGVQGDLSVEVISDKLKSGDIIALNPDESFTSGMKVVTDNGSGKKGK